MRTIKVSADTVRPEDVVLIRATVVRNQPGVGVLVRLLSKTDVYDAWVRHDLIEPEATRVDVPVEPADGTWVQGEVDGELNVFGRLDERAAEHGKTITRWLDVGASEWVTWDQAYRRGADPDRPIPGAQ